MKHFLNNIDSTIKIQTPIVFGKLLKFDMLTLTLAQFYESLLSNEVLIY